MQEFIIEEEPTYKKTFDNDGQLYNELITVCATEQVAENVFRHLTNWIDDAVQVGNYGFQRLK